MGWAGHTKDFGVKGSVEKTFKKVRNHVVENVIRSITVDFETGEGFNIPLKHVTLKRVNYPHNCYTLDLTSVNHKRDESMKTLYIEFMSGNLEKVQIGLQGITLASNREIFDNSFHTKGDKISVTPGRINKYAVEISKNVYLEEDKSKKCRDYPNSKYASYMECDDRFMKDICERVKLAPIWLLDDISQATTNAVLNGSGRCKGLALGYFFDSSDAQRCFSKFDGYDTCKQPCTTFQTQTRFVSGLKTEPDWMNVRIKFSPKVTKEILFRQGQDTLSENLK